MSTIPPPPPSQKPQHLRPSGSEVDEGIIVEENFSVSKARALFEAAKSPVVQQAASAVAKNPVLRNVAINTAKDPNTRNAALSYMHSQSNNPPPVPKKGGDVPPPPPPHRASSNAAPPKTFYKEPSFELAPPAPSFAPPPIPAKTSPSSRPAYPSMIDELKSLHVNTSGPTHKTSPSQFQPSKGVIPPKPSRPPPPRPGNSPRMPPAPITEPHAVVQYPFNGIQGDELNCEVNDVIELKKEVDDQWIYGLNTRTGKQGIIPFGFIEVKVPLVPTSTSHTAVALYDYFSNAPGDLQFRTNDVIQVKEWASPEWLLGSLYGQNGLFPANFVSCPSLNSVPIGASYNSQAAGPIGVFIALYDYNSGVAGDLVFKTGDQIEVMEYVGQDWVRGRLHSQEGLLPFTYLSSSAPKKSPQGLASISSIASIPARLFQAMDDHHSDDASNLYFSKGDRLVIVEEVDDHFYRGKLEEFKTLPPGLVPRSKVVEI